MNDKNIIAGIVVIILLVGGGLFWVSGGSGVTTTGTAQNAPEGATELAQCLADKGVIFYGAFWCPHCQKQKKLFGSAEKLLPYIECSTPDGKGQLLICKERGIQSYPTWTFPDGTRETGELSFETLRQKSGCGAIEQSAETTLEVATPVIPATVPPVLP